MNSNIERLKHVYDLLADVTIVLALKSAGKGDTIYLIKEG